jgi:hypothetical protein
MPTSTSTTPVVPVQPGPPNVAPGTIALNAVKGIADASLPGASLLIEGNIKSGTLHVVSGLVARALFGPIGWIAVAADSFSLSVTGKHLYQQFVNVDVDVSKAQPTQPPT